MRRRVFIERESLAAGANTHAQKQTHKQRHLQNKQKPQQQ
jgi:hypothetical protein